MDSLGPEILRGEPLQHWRHHVDPAYDADPPEWYLAAVAADAIIGDPPVDAAEILNTDRLTEG